ncbi:hypothetical protein ACFSGX_14155 [Sphingomonas arantia]|uniref:Uncharacterized protein n=1 Tax=Sphingomonas arantia TaxID=1460676 RepID=A0ABW4U1S9_9SPHN
MPSLPHPPAAPVVRPDQPAPPAHWIDPTRVDDDHPAVRDWLAHIAAGRIGAPLPVNPVVVAVRDHNAALIARRAQAARAAGKQP